MKKEIEKYIAKLNKEIDKRIWAGKPYGDLSKKHRNAVNDLRYAQ